MRVQIELLLLSALYVVSYTQVVPPQLIVPVKAKTDYVLKNHVLQCTATGDPQPEYRWEKDGMEMPGPANVDHMSVNKKNGTLVITDITSNEEGRYQCFASSPVPDGKGGEKILIALSAEIEVKIVDLGIWTKPDKDNKEVTQGEYLSMACQDQPLSVPKATFLWFITDGNQEKKAVTENDRKFIDGNGTLHLIYAEDSDEPDTSWVYQCAVYNGMKDTILLGGEISLTVKDQPLESLAPVLRSWTYKDDAVFLNKSDATLECVFSGFNIPEITWKMDTVDNILPRNNKYEYVEGTRGRRLIIHDLTPDDEGMYMCEARNSMGAAIGSIWLDVTSIPQWTEGLASQTVVEGRDAVFSCKAVSMPGELAPKEPQWFINGQPFTEDYDKGKFEFSDRKRRLTVRNVNKATDVNCFQCNVTNHIGYTFGDGCLTIIKGILILSEPPLRQEINKGDQINLTVIGKTDSAMNLRYQWRFKNVTYSVDPPPFVFYNSTTKVAYINTSNLNDDEYDSVRGIYYRELYHKYDTVVVPIEVVLVDKPVVIPVTGTAGSLWWVALIVALIVLIIVIILIVIICNRKMQEGDYPVDKKERANDIDPEKDLAESGFQDLSHAPGDPDFEGKKTPNLNPTFDYGDDMDMGDDDESLMEYGGGDIDTTKFNEDGSFIGQYRDKTPQVAQQPLPLNNHQESQI